MKKFYIFLIGLILSMYSSFSGATPPTHIQLSYDIEAQKLYIEANHPSDKLDKHYIHKVVVVKNSQEAQEFYFTRQGEPAKFVTNLDYKADAGDHLDVQLFCIQGGKAQSSLDISKPEEKKDNDQKVISNRT